MPLITSQYQPSAGYAVGGIGSVLEWGDVVLNDKRFPDRIVVTEITGLDGADVRDGRQGRADSTGEIALIARHGGRNIGMTGVLEAGNYSRVLQMREDLQAAGLELVEQPLFIRPGGLPGHWDRFFRDSFAWPSIGTRTLVSGVYQQVAGAYTVYSLAASAPPPSAVGGYLITPDTAERNMAWTYAQSRHADLEVRVRFQTGDATNTLSLGPILKLLDGANFLYAEVNGSSNQLRITKKDGGTVTTLGSTAAVILPATDYWLRARIVGDVVTAELWAQEPTDWFGETATVVARLSYTLLSGNSVKYGANVLGYGGMRWTTAGVNEAIRELRVLPWSTRDTLLHCRRVAPLQSRERQDKHPRREFLLTLRASNPRLLSTVVNETLIDQIAIGVGAQYGRIFDSTWDKTFDQLLDGLGDPVDTAPVTVYRLRNRGNTSAQTLIRIFGRITNPTVLNMTTGRSFSLATSIETGDWREADAASRTFVDSLGANRFQELAEGTDWLELARGDNYLKVIADSWDSSAEVKVIWRDSTL